MPGLSWEFLGPFAGTFFGLFFRHPLLAAMVVFLLLVLVGNFGRRFGAPYVFYHARFGVQFCAGIAVALLLATILFVGYLLSSQPPKSTQQGKQVAQEIVTPGLGTADVGFYTGSGQGNYFVFDPSVRAIAIWGMPTGPTCLPKKSSN